MFKNSLLSSLFVAMTATATAQVGFYERFPDDLTKPFDLSNSQLILTPNPAAADGSGFNKSLKLGTETALPYPNFQTDPGASLVSFGYQNDFNVAKIWIGNLTFSYGGTSYIGCYVHSNGYIEFKTGTGPTGSLYRDGVGGAIGTSTRDNAFSQLAVYPLWDDHEWYPTAPSIPNLPGDAGTVWFRVINGDRAIITFDRIPEITSNPGSDPDDPGPAGSTNENTFQVQFLQTGQIIINWTTITDRTCLVGASLTSSGTMPIELNISSLAQPPAASNWMVF